MFFFVQRCIDTESTTAPRKVCFCAMGYFGKNCQNHSPWTGKVNLENNGYVKRNFKDIFDIYWKIIGNEIEVVMQAATENFVAVGFRPGDAQKSCQAFPELKNRPDTSSVGGEAESESEPESEAESESEPEGEAESESEPDGKAKYEGEAESHSEPEDEAESESEPEGEAESESEPEGEAESESEPEGEAKSHSESEGAESESEPEVEAESQSEPEGEAESESEPEGEAYNHNEPEGEAESESEPEGEPDTQSEPEGEAESESKPDGLASNIKKSKYVNQYQPKGRVFHPMDCQDIVLGMARGMYSRIYDSYTRDRLEIDH